MKKSIRRTPKNYDGPLVTTHHASDVAPAVLRGIAGALQERPDLVIAAWKTVIGSNLMAMTEAISFTSGVLVVRVRNSTLYSLLSQRDKSRLLANLRRHLPNTTIHDLVFRMS